MVNRNIHQEHRNSPYVGILHLFHGHGPAIGTPIESRNLRSAANPTHGSGSSPKRLFSCWHSKIIIASRSEHYLLLAGELPGTERLAATSKDVLIAAFPVVASLYLQRDFQPYMVVKFQLGPTTTYLPFWRRVSASLAFVFIPGPQNTAMGTLSHFTTVCQVHILFSKFLTRRSCSSAQGLMMMSCQHVLALNQDVRVFREMSFWTNTAFASLCSGRLT